MMSDLSTDYTREQLIDALLAEYQRLCHDDPEDDDMTDEEYLQSLSSLTYEELVEETVTDDEYFTLANYMEAYA